MVGPSQLGTCYNHRMIASLTGKVTSKQERTLILDVGGVGYLVHTPRGLLEKTQLEHNLSLCVYTNVREDDISLYGFETLEEWSFFRLLLTVSGVGPKSALEILNAPLPRVKNAIAKKDTGFLTNIPGIGKKTAERIIVDLQGKVQESLLEDFTEESASISEDIVQALVELGYSRHHVIDGLKKIPADIEGEEAVIKYFLQHR